MLYTLVKRVFFVGSTLLLGTGPAFSAELPSCAGTLITRYRSVENQAFFLAKNRTFFKDRYSQFCFLSGGLAREFDFASAENKLCPVFSESTDPDSENSKQANYKRALDQVNHSIQSLYTRCSRAQSDAANYELSIQSVSLVYKGLAAIREMFEMQSRSP